MIEYWKKEKERPVLEGTLQQAEAEVQAARRKAALGMLSQPELLEAVRLRQQKPQGRLSRRSCAAS